MSFNDYINENISKIDKRVYAELNEMLTFDIYNILKGISLCESPIEKLLYVRLYQYVRDFDLLYKTDTKVFMQTKILIKKKTYRLDFLIEVTYKEKCFKLVIECDGYEFHEKTKEQAIRDKSRDRILQINGYTVMRFTGSEIWNNPRKCSSEVLMTLRKIINIEEDLCPFRKD